MKTQRFAGDGLVAAALLLIAGIVPHMAAAESRVHFDRVETDGVTTDHASTGGVSWIDYDGDGDLDLFVTNGYDVSASAPAPQPNRLYQNDGNGGFAVVTTGALATSLGISSGSTWGDYDNDGDLDVFITNQQDKNNFLFRNEGGGEFVAVTDEPQTTDGGHSYAATWVDIDNDGSLDLFVANGGMSHSGKNALYRNAGDGHFVKVTEGALVADQAMTCGIAWGDYDNDGDLDLFLANAGFGAPANNDALYRNDGNMSFTKIEDSPVVSDGAPSCAATWVDVDNDQDLDLHVTTMYGMANLLYVNDGNGGLTPADASPLNLDGGHSYGANWEDYNNDGNIDCLVANWGAAPALYLGNGDGTFSAARGGDICGRVEYPGAMASGDIDGDGDIDVCIGNWPNNPGPGELNALFRNHGGGHWLRVHPMGRGRIGARVVVTSRRDGAPLVQMREVTTQAGFRGQSDSSPHFGLGSSDGRVSLEVRWPSGRVTSMTDVAVDQVVNVVEVLENSGEVKVR